MDKYNFHAKSKIQNRYLFNRLIIWANDLRTRLCVFYAESVLMSDFFTGCKTFTQVLLFQSKVTPVDCGWSGIFLWYDSCCLIAADWVGYICQWFKN